MKFEVYDDSREEKQVCLRLRKIVSWGRDKVVLCVVDPQTGEPEINGNILEIDEQGVYLIEGLSSAYGIARDPQNSNRVRIRGPGVKEPYDGIQFAKKPGYRCW